MVPSRPLLAIACALVVAVADPASARVERIETDETCWSMLNELAAAAVFADLSDEKLETIYGLLDRLQDSCEAQTFVEATEIKQAIEALVGK